MFRVSNLLKLIIKQYSATECFIKSINLIQFYISKTVPSRLFISFPTICIIWLTSWKYDVLTYLLWEILLVLVILIKLIKSVLFLADKRIWCNELEKKRRKQCKCKSVCNLFYFSCVALHGVKLGYFFVCAIEKWLCFLGLNTSDCSISINVLKIINKYAG